ncbi:MAG: DNA-3-methyladenine glycosylase [Candidatus Omnitrophica bacterium]|nr:DNA-3-methyladenine glycosylase [Candidatus Omnitrophota bacterium]
MIVLEDLRDFKISLLRKRMRTKHFFLNQAPYVAYHLLGDYIVVAKGRKNLVGRIVETEAYLGVEDDASHAFGGKFTSRNKFLYQEGGIIYVYLIYGKFWCFNVVVSRKGNPQAVFIRAIQPLRGVEIMRKNRGGRDQRELTNGPGRWTQALSIDGRLLGRSITSRDFFISTGLYKGFSVVRTRRIGVDYAVRCKDLPLRYYIKNNPFVSVK